MPLIFLFGEFPQFFSLSRMVPRNSRSAAKRRNSTMTVTQDTTIGRWDGNGNGVGVNLMCLLKKDQELSAC